VKCRTGCGSRPPGRVVDALVDTEWPNEYDAAVDLLDDLRTVAERTCDRYTYVMPER
jgi:hypothetical protein